MRQLAGSLVLLSAAAPALFGQAASGTVDADFFETKIRPLFAEKCYACHTDKRMGGLQLDSREHFLKGGKSGPIAVPGDPGASLLVKALRYDANPKMPPTGKLAAGQIAAVEAWVKAGAVWPNDEKAAVKPPPYRITAEQHAFWSFEPVKPVLPPDVQDTRWARTEIDHFIAAKLEARGLHPVRGASRHTLIRRASYDLTGLPPSAEEVDAFEHDRSPEAFAKVIDRLLASPRYGERWGRLWLDVARYSDDRLDSERDNPYPASFRYRDWVIQAIQNDMPYDVFVKAQIAGDRLPDHEKYEAGLGFYALSPEMQDDRVDATARGFLGLTVACAQCHDHKYDPIPTSDFYSLLGIFRNTELHEIALAPKEAVDAYKAQDALVHKKEKELKEYVGAQSAQLGLILASETARYLLASGQPSNHPSNEDGDPIAGPALDRETLARWTKYLAEPEKQHPFLKDWYAASTQDQRAKAAAEFQTQVLAVMTEKAHIDDENHVRLGLDPTREDLSNANLVSLDRAKFGLWEDLLGDHGVLHYGGTDKEETKIDRFLSGVWLDHLNRLRAQLAALKKELPPAYPVLQTITDKEKPEEQHIWIRGDQNNPGDLAPPHFLAILSRAGPEPFARGKERLELAEAIASPANPLTARVMVNRVWQQHFGYGLVRTPSNFGSQGDRPSHPELLDYLADRFVREGWSLKKLHREIMLTATYESSDESSDRNYAEDPDNRLLWRYNRRRLDAESLRDSILFVSGKLDLKAGGPAVRINGENNRRTVYAFISRRQLDPMLALFDFPNPNNTSEQRLQTTVPLQKLFFMNSPFVIDQSTALMARVAAIAWNDDERITATYRFVLQREPTPEERRLAHEFVAGNAGAWPEYGQVMLSSNEFTYIN
ncbi:MAG TPA: PSD1 and planctomycete cytochrome C domain-containing protein [Bryobacteraceae bacterium]|nr:PSD1 and planctomycete cytochrome C domain-containing protein [Bryobacteraceae bacterium]